MSKFENYKSSFLNNPYDGEHSVSLDDDDYGFSLTWNKDSKIGMYCRRIFEGEHFDMYIDCDPEVRLFESAEKCWNYYKKEIKENLEEYEEIEDENEDGEDDEDSEYVY